MRLVQKTLSWKFLVLHIPGSKLGGPDALSRHMPSHMNNIPDATQSSAWETAPCSNTGVSSPGLQPEDQGEEVTICKEDIWNILAALRAGTAKEHSTPDPVLASVKLDNEV